MPDKLSIDDSNYTRKLDRARSLLSERAPWWNHSAASDPGITLIELWALLTDMQSYYMDQMQEGHYRKHLKLLGILPDEGNRASAWVSMEQVKREMVLPKGTRLMADSMVFETDRANLLTVNRIKSFCLGESSVNLAEGMTLSRKGRFPLREGERTLFTLTLEEPVKKGGLLELFILLDEKNGRNPFEDDDFYMARLVWECRTESGWNRVETLRDGTCGLLRSGKLVLRMSGAALRCRIEEGAFDRMPTLYRVMLNVVRAGQQETLCQSLIFPWNGEERIFMPDYLSRTGRVEVYAAAGEGAWEDFTGFCEISPPVANVWERRFVAFSMERFGRVPPVGRRALKLVCSEPGFREEAPGWDATGVSSMRIALPWANIYRPSLGLQLQEGEGGGVFLDYECAEPEACGERLFHWDDAENAIVFGDGRHGAIPEKAGGGIRIDSLCLWEGEKGNTAYGRINRVARPDLCGGLACCNYMAAAGGRDRITAGEQARALAGLWDPWERAVTLADYAGLARTAPGLIITGARAEAAGKGRILLTVETPAAGKDWAAARYREKLRAHLDRFRMVTDVIDLRFAEPAGEPEREAEV